MADRNELRKPGLGEMNLGSLAGAVVGSVGGLFSVGIPPAIVFHDMQALFQTPKIAVICFVIAGAMGWLIGGQMGPVFGRRYNTPWAEIAGGGAGGIIPVLMVLGWSYSMVT
jgi:hypothetical protein